MKAFKLAALLMAALLLFGCHKEKPADVPSEPEAPPPPVEEPDPNWPARAAGVLLEEKPEAVVSLSPALTEIVYELGGTLSGVSDYCDYPEAAASLERCGAADAPAFDAIDGLEPDLVLSSVPLAESVRIQMEERGIPVAVFPRAAGLDELEQTYVDLATLLGGAVDGPDNGKAVFGALRDRYDALAAAVPAEPELSGIWLRAVPLVMATGDTFEGSLLEKALGVRNDAAEFTGWQYPADKAVDLYPDVIFYDESIDPAYFAGTTVYSTTDAFKQKRMYAFSALPFERQSGRMFDELERMARALAGELPTEAEASGEASDAGAAGAEAAGG